ncbi:MAG: MFS transporter [Syntrophomonas sp.]|nr:MFS transporter [Syntrophomonas sp.]
MINPGRIHYGFYVLIACCAIGLTTAITWNCAGIFIVPVISELSLNRGPFSLYLTIIALVMTFFLPLAGKIFAYKNARVILSVCVLVNAAGIGAMSFFTSVYHFYIAAVFLGFAQTFLLVLATPSLINRWFHSQKGLILGICSAFTGIGAVILNPVGGYIIEIYGWRTAYLVLGAIIAIFVFPVVALLIRNYPSDMGLKPYGYSAEKSPEINNNPEVGTGVSVSTAIKSAPFLILVIFEFAMGLYNSFNVSLPSYASSIGMGVIVASTIGSASMLGSLLGKIGLGYLNDKTVMGALIICGVCGFSGVGILSLTGSASPIFILAGAFLFGICMSASQVQAPLLVMKIFGTRQFSQIYSIVMMVFSLVQAIGQSLWGFIADANGGSYSLPLTIIMGIVLIIPMAGCLAYNGRKIFEFTTANNT